VQKAGQLPTFGNEANSAAGADELVGQFADKLWMTARWHLVTQGGTFDERMILCGLDGF
jgi:hypothetical protein